MKTTSSLRILPILLVIASSATSAQAVPMLDILRFETSGILHARVSFLSFFDSEYADTPTKDPNWKLRFHTGGEMFETTIGTLTPDPDPGYTLSSFSYTPSTYGYIHVSSPLHQFQSIGINGSYRGMINGSNQPYFMTALPFIRQELPDGGTTGLMMAGSLAGMGLLRIKRKKATAR